MLPQDVCRNDFRIPYFENQLDDSADNKELQDSVNQTSENKIINVTEQSLPIQQTNSNSIANRKISFGSKIINKIKDKYPKLFIKYIVDNDLKIPPEKDDGFIHKVKV